jgi:hypothetical protein
MSVHRCAAAVSAVLVVSLAACSDSIVLPSAPSDPWVSFQIPTSQPVVTVPSPPRPAVPESVFLPDVTLSGTVYELAGNPSQPVGIEGVSVYCEQCGESTHNFAVTNSKGAYVFPRGFWTEGRPGLSARILVSRDGYADPPGRSSDRWGAGWREVVMDGDTRIDIELVRR